MNNDELVNAYKDLINYKLIDKNAVDFNCALLESIRNNSISSINMLIDHFSDEIDQETSQKAFRLSIENSASQIIKKIFQFKMKKEMLDE